MRRHRRLLCGLTMCVLAAGTVHGQADADEDAPGPAPSPRSFTMAVSGDIIPLPSVYKRARWNVRPQVGYDFAPMFADVAPIVSAADLAICHLEIPITPPGTKPTGHPRWASPPEIVPAMVGAGYDRCSTASNHVLDKGPAGIAATLDTFDAHGLGHSGSARTPQEAVPEIFEVNGVRVAHLSYSYSFFPIRLKVGEEWRANKIDLQKILAAAADARSRGAEVTVLSMHWGSSMSKKPTKAQRAMTEVLTASGLIDLIVGHHAHVMQPIEQVNGVWVLWNLGNHMSNHRPETGWPAASEDGAIVTLRVVEGDDGSFAFDRPVAHPTWSQPVTMVVVDALEHAADPTFSKSALRRMAQSLARTRKLIGAYFPS